MLDIATTPVVRTISLSLRDENRGRMVREASVLTKRTQTADFLRVVFPKQKIEHLGRTDMLNVKGLYGKIAPTSLFFQSIYLAYAEHHAFGFRPEVLMYLVNAVVAETIRRYPEDYRDLFTAEAAKVDIHVRHDGLVLGNPTSPWNEAIGEFDEALRPHVSSDIMNHMLPDFTTADEESNMASLVSFMDAASPYYDYHTHTMCGIPRVVLFGEASDYRKLVAAATNLAERFKKHLAVYFANLLPILETIAEAATGARINENFWGQIYKQFEASGTDRFSGWISSFLWYVHEEHYETETNPLVVKSADMANWKNIGRYNGLSSGSEPSHVSRVPFTWHYLNQVFPMHFVGGILGVEEAEGALTPALSYGVLRA